MGWKTIRTFHREEPFRFRGQEIPVNAIYCLKEGPRGPAYWAAFWRDRGKVKSVHIGRELPFPEPEPKPTYEELWLTVSKLTEANRRLRERIKELEEAVPLKARDADGRLKIKPREADIVNLTGTDNRLNFEPVQLSTFEGMDGILRAEAAVLTITNVSKVLEVRLYPDKGATFHYRPGKRLWKSIDQAEAAKVFRSWRPAGLSYDFKKGSPDRRVETRMSATVTAKECIAVLRAE